MITQDVNDFLKKQDLCHLLRRGAQDVVWYFLYVFRDRVYSIIRVCSKSDCMQSSVQIMYNQIT